MFKLAELSLGTHGPGDRIREYHVKEITSHLYVQVFYHMGIQSLVYSLRSHVPLR